MAGRKKKNTVDYFPHYIGEGKKIQYIEAKYGNDGYACWFKILESLATTPNHYIDLNNEMETVFLAQKCRVSETLLKSILQDLSMLGSINKLFFEKGYVWSEIFIESIKDTYKKRTTFSLSFQDLYHHLFESNKSLKNETDTEIENLAISDAEIAITDAEIPISDGIKREIRKEEKKIKRKEEIYSELEISVEKIEQVKNDWESYAWNDFETPKLDLLNDHEFVSRLAQDQVISKEEAISWIDNFFKNISFTKESKTNLQAYRKHCKNWISMKIQHQKNYNNGNQKQRTSERTDARSPEGGYGKL